MGKSRPVEMSEAVLLHVADEGQYLAIAYSASAPVSARQPRPALDLGEAGIPREAGRRPGRTWFLGRHSIDAGHRDGRAGLVFVVRTGSPPLPIRSPTRPGGP